MKDIYTIDSTNPADIPKILWLVPGGQTMQQTKTGGKVPGVYLQPGTTQSLRYAACIAEDLGPHLQGRPIVRDAKGQRIDGLTLAAEVRAGRLGS
jgi:hypothetical protein